jgi:hypothetical protein
MEATKLRSCAVNSSKYEGTKNLYNLDNVAHNGQLSNTFPPSLPAIATTTTKFAWCDAHRHTSNL